MNEKSFLFYLDENRVPSITMHPCYYEDIEKEKMEQIRENFEELKDHKLEDISWKKYLENNKYVVFKKINK